MKTYPMDYRGKTVQVTVPPREDDIDDGMTPQEAAEEDFWRREAVSHEDSEWLP